jgi:hypothetical protein
VKIELSLHFGKDGNSAEVTPTNPHQPKRRHFKRTISVAVIVVAVAATVMALYLRLSDNQTTTNPFTAKVQSSVQFPLYYPTSLPAGYTIDSESVTEPHTGVVAFKLVSQNGGIMYVSEEARPQSFDLGGFYKQFTSYRGLAVSDGTIATGYVRSGQTEIASRANNQTWVLVTTSERVSQNQLIGMMRSLTVGY